MNDLAPLGRGGGGKGGSSGTGYEAPNTLRSKSTATLMDVLGEGPLEGLVDGLKSVFLNDVQLLGPDGTTYNYKGVNLALMAGLPDQAALPGFTSQEHEVVVATQVKVSTGPLVKTINTTPITGIRVTIRIPALAYQNKETGDVTATRLEFKIEWKASDTAWSEAVHDTINGKCTSAYEKSYRIPITGTAPYQVRMTRITPDKGDATNIYNDLWWASYTELLEWTLSYPDTSYAWLTLDSELVGGAIPSRAYEVKGLRIKVPSNYDPIARTYTGLWDGTFTTAWTNNPAWVFYDLLTNTRYGLGHDIPEDLIDKWALYQIAQYCDELVPDGEGGTEPRFVFNGVLNTATEAWAALQTVAACFRGMCYYGAGLITATQDAPGSPVKLVTNANVIGGHFSYEGTGNRARHTLARVMFSDMDDAYRPSIEPVEADDIADRGIYPIDVAAIGTTSRTQARRIGKWVLDSERNEAETVSYQCSLDHADVRPGDLILIADRWYAGVRMGGRVVSATSTSVTLDAAVELEVGQTYQLRVTQPDGTVALRDVTNGPGTHSTLSFVTVLSSIPNTESVWMLSGSNVQPRTFRVIAMTMPEKNIFEVSALFHDATKYDRIEQNMAPLPPPFIDVPSGALTPPSELSITEYLIIYGAAARATVTLSWKPSADPRVQFYAVEATVPGADGWQPMGTTRTNSLAIYDLMAGAASFRVRGVTGLGGINGYSEWVTLDATLEGIEQVPEDVTTLTATVLGDRLRLAWEPVREHAFCFYNIRYNPDVTATAWEAAIDIEKKQNGTSIDVPLRDGIYMVKAVTYASVPSANPVSTVVSAVAIQQLNSVMTIEEAPAWEGTKVNTVVNGSALQLSPGQESGTYVFDTGDFGAVYTSRVTASLNGAGVTAGDYMDQWTALASVPALASSLTGSSWSATLEYRYATVYPVDDIDWSAWLPFQVADITARILEFRLTIATLDGGVTLPEMYACTVQVDLPDRVEGESDIAVAAAGTRISFATPFRVTPAIAVTGQSLATGDYWQITNQDPYGFDLRFFTSAGAGVARTADWIAKGYGRRGSQDAAKASWDFSEGAVPSNLEFTRSSAATVWRALPDGPLYNGRSTSAWYWNSAGVLTEALPFKARIGYNPSDLTLLGVLREVARTNYVRNPRLLGATTGVLGSGGALPTGWSATTMAGLTSTVTAGVTEDGMQCVDIQLSGTPSSGGTFIFTLDSSVMVAPAAVGQTWCQSIFWRLTAGSLTGVSSPRFTMSENNSGGTSLRSVNPGLTVPTGAALRTQRVYGTITCTQALTAFVSADLRLTIAAGVAVNCTLRFAIPQLERGSGPTTPIMPADGTVATSTRGADIAAPNDSAEYMTTVPANLWFCSRGTTGTYFDSGGTLQEAAAFIPRVGYDPVTGASLGVLDEPEGKNFVANPGGWNTGLLYPSGWGAWTDNAGTVVVSVAARGFESGMRYVDIRVAGTPTGGGRTIIWLHDTGPQGQFAPGAYATGTVFIKMVSGALPLGFLNPTLFELNSAGGYLYGWFSAPQVTPNSTDALTKQRTVVTRKMVNNLTRGALWSIEIGHTSGVAHDYTIRIGGAQFEKGGVATSLMQPPDGTVAVTTRQADFLSKVKLIEVGPDEPRFEDSPLTGEYLGLLVESARTNLMRNPRLEGAVAGTPGTRPTNWSSGGTTGQTIVGTGVIDGIPYIELEVALSAVGTYWWEFPEQPNSSCAAGERVMFTAYMQLVEGDFSNALNPRVQIDFLSATPAILAQNHFTISGMTRAPMRMQRFSFSAVAPASTATVRVSFAANYNTGQVRFRLRVGGVMIEKTSGGAPGTRPSNLILPPVGTTSTTPTRAAETPMDTDMSWLTTTARGTVMSEFVLSESQGSYPRLFQAKDTATTNYIESWVYPGTVTGRNAFGGATQQASFYGGALSHYVPARTVYRWNAGSLRISWGGAALQENPAGSYAGDPVLPFTSMTFGTGGFALDGWMRRVSWYVGSAKTDAEVRSLSTPVPRTHQAAAFLAGGGGIVGTARQAAQISAALSGAGSVAAAATRITQASATLSGVGTITG